MQKRSTINSKKIRIEMYLLSVFFIVMLLLH